MRRTRFAVVTFVLGLLALGAALPGSVVPAGAAAGTPPPPVPPRAWILVDLDRGVVLDASHPHEPLPVASAGKLMTALLAVHRLSADAPIPVDAIAAARPPSKIGMRVGQTWSREQALLSTLVVSANDAAYALGAAAAGSLNGFGAAAAAEGRSLGLLDSTWVDPAGLDGIDGLGSGNLVSAFDLAVLGRAVLADPVLAPMVRLQLSTFVGPDGLKHTLHQHNKLLATYPGAIGLKTGYTSNAGQVLVAAAERGGRTFVAVTIGGSDEYGPATRLLDKGFASTADDVGTGERLPGMTDPITSVAPPSSSAGLIDPSKLDGLGSVERLVAGLGTVILTFGLLSAWFRRGRRTAA